MTDPYTREVLFVVYNAAEKDVEITLPDGTWDMYINGDAAGADPIASGLSAKQKISAVSCHVYKKN
jgi:hypothetical protein